MNALRRLRDVVAQADGYSIVLQPAASSDSIAACGRAVGSVLSRSLRELLSECDGFELLDEHGSVLRLYSTSEIAYSTTESRELFSDENGVGVWGDFISIARSNHTESEYGIRPSQADTDESPLYEINLDGWDTWDTDPPLAPTLSDWLVMIADAIASGDHERVYDTMWLGPYSENEPSE